MICYQEALQNAYSYAGDVSKKRNKKITRKTVPWWADELIIHRTINNGMLKKVRKRPYLEEKKYDTQIN